MEASHIKGRTVSFGRQGLSKSHGLWIIYILKVGLWNSLSRHFGSG